MKLIYKHDLLIEIFDDISPFNMKKDIKYLEKKHISVDKVMQEIEATFNLRHYDVVIERVLCQSIHAIVLVKVRIINPQTNKGESSGFRVIAVVDECEDHAFIFNLFHKTGAGRKDNLTTEELTKAKSLFYEYIEESQ